MHSAECHTLENSTNQCLPRILICVLEILIHKFA